MSAKKLPIKDGLMKKNELKNILSFGLFFLILGSAHADLTEKQILISDKTDVTLRVIGADGSTLGMCSGKSLQACCNVTVICALPGSVQITNNSTVLTAMNIRASSSDSNFNNLNQTNSQNNPSGCNLAPGASCNLIFSTNNPRGLSYSLSANVTGTNTSNVCLNVTYQQCL